MSNDLIVAGAAPDTGNRGVSALCESVVVALLDRLPDHRVVILDHGTGLRPCTLTPGYGDRLVSLGARHSRRYNKPESFTRIRLAARLGGFATPPARLIRNAAAILDISGGDSFTDLYGRRRLDTVMQPKLIAMEQRVPLILLPQTYGPFASTTNAAIARRAVRAATCAWARDERSYEVLKTLLADDYDPDRHRSGVDVAFELRAREPDADALGPIRPLLEADGDGPLIGLNVSGLIYGDPEGARDRFGFKCDYRTLIHDTARSLVRSGARLLLLAHVLGPPGGGADADPQACRDTLEVLGDEARERAALVPPTLDQAELKWVIGKCDWFCGTRMHSTIAGLSQGIPTAAVSYSPKTLGVFQTVDQGDAVIDPCTCETEEAVDRLLACFGARAAARERLAAALPAVKARASEQMDAIAAVIRGG